MIYLLYIRYTSVLFKSLLSCKFLNMTLWHHGTRLVLSLPVGPAVLPAYSGRRGAHPADAHVHGGVLLHVGLLLEPLAADPALERPLSRVYSEVCF